MRHVGRAEEIGNTRTILVRRSREKKSEGHESKCELQSASEKLGVAKLNI
jgi:hypothetical protein